MIEPLSRRSSAICCARPALTLVLSCARFGAVALHLRQFCNYDGYQSAHLLALAWRQRERQFDAAFPQHTDTSWWSSTAQRPELAETAAKRLAAALAEATAAHLKACGGATAAPSSRRTASCSSPPDEVRHTTEQPIRAQPFLGTLAADPTLHGLAKALASSRWAWRRDKRRSRISKSRLTVLADRPSMRSSPGKPPHSRGAS